MVSKSETARNPGSQISRDPPTIMPIVQVYLQATKPDIIMIMMIALLIVFASCCMGWITPGWVLEGMLPA